MIKVQQYKNILKNSVHLRKFEDNTNLSNQKIINNLIEEKKIKKNYDIYCMLYISTP